jgi:hypothetical protein
MSSRLEHFLCTRCLPVVGIEEPLQESGFLNFSKTSSILAWIAGAIGFSELGRLVVVARGVAIVRLHYRTHGVKGQTWWLRLERG